MKKNISKTLTVTLAIIFIISFFAFSYFAFAAEIKSSSVIPDFNFQIPIPGLSAADLRPTVEGNKIVFHGLANFIVAAYRYLVGATAILAVFFIAFAGLKWMLAGGNSSNVSKAKEDISNALVGLLLVLGSYFILYTINPNLVNLQPISITMPGQTAFTPEKVTLPSGGSGNNNSPVGGRKCSGGLCADLDQYIANNAGGIEPAILKTMIVGGEGCNKANSSDGLGSCGYGQLLPYNRTYYCGLQGTGQETCKAVQNDPKIDIDCMSMYFKKYILPMCKGKESDIRCLGSYYNDGGNCAETTKDYCGRVEKYLNSCTD